MSDTRYSGLREPDLWQVGIEDSEDTYTFATESDAEAHAKNVRAELLDEWNDDNEGAEYGGPTVDVEPVWIGDARSAPPEVPRGEACARCGYRANVKWSGIIVVGDQLRSTDDG